MIKPANLQFALPIALGRRLVGDPHADRNPHSTTSIVAVFQAFFAPEGAPVLEFAVLLRHSIKDFIQAQPAHFRDSVRGCPVQRRE